MKNYSFLGLILFSASLYSAEYHIGPEQGMKELTEVNWLSLVGGDTVFIHCRTEPYRTKIGLNAAGTSEAEIKIVGIPCDDGRLPVLDGANAVTPESLKGFFSSQWDEANGLIVIKRASTNSWGYKPKHIVIENLKITGASERNTFTDQFGNERRYSQSASGVWATVVENLTLHKNIIEDNGNGIFILSKNSEEELSRNILIRDNFFNLNGVAGSFRQHHIYTQSKGIVVEHNTFGHIYPGSIGSAIKDRSVDTVIRFNDILAGAYALDLVDPEDSYGVIYDEVNDAPTYVYGNLIKSIANPTYFYSSRLVHFGGDTGVPAIYRKGKLYFYNNSVYMKLDKKDRWNSLLFVAGTNEQKIDFCNNVVVLEGDSSLNLIGTTGHISVSCNNLLSRNIQPLGERNGMTSKDFEFITESANTFADASNNNFHLSPTSLGHDRSTFADYITELKYQPSTGFGFAARERIGSMDDLGAFESESYYVDPKIQGLVASNITNDSAVLSWSFNTVTIPDASFDVVVNGVLFDSTKTSPITLIGLKSSTAYSVKVIAKSDANLDIVSASLDFSTTERAISDGPNPDVPPATWGALPTPDGAIESVYPSPGTAVSIEDKVAIKLTGKSSFEWTAGRKLYVHDDVGNLIHVVDPNETSVYQGITVLEFSVKELGISVPGNYSITLDQGFVRVPHLPWKNAAVGSGLWSFKVVNPAPTITPNASWGKLDIDVATIDSVYPAHGQIVSSMDSIKIKFNGKLSYEYTKGRKLSVLSEDGTLLHSVDVEPGDKSSGKDVYELVIKDLKLPPGSLIHIKIDPVAFRIDKAPWRSGDLPTGFWSFTVL